MSEPRPTHLRPGPTRRQHDDGRAWATKRLDPGLLFPTIEEAVLPRPGSLTLDRGPDGAYVHRLTSGVTNVAEQYHVNSRLHPHALDNIPLDEKLCRAIADWYFTTGYRPRAEDLDDATAVAWRARVPVAALSPPLRRFFGALGAEGDLWSVWYGLDFWALQGGELFRIPPTGEFAWKERDLGDQERLRLRAALFFDDAPAVPIDTTVFVAAVPWRYMLLQGPRGYRRSLLDAGRALEVFAGCRGSGALAGVAVTDFHDREIEDLLALDGVERQPVLCLAMYEPDDAS